MSHYAARKACCSSAFNTDCDRHAVAYAGSAWCSQARAGRHDSPKLHRNGDRTKRATSKRPLLGVSLLAPDAHANASKLMAHPTPRDVSLRASPHGQLKITRSKGIMRDRFRAYHVVVDKSDVGEIRRGQSLVFPVSPGQHEVHLEIDWCRSQSLMLEFRPGQDISLRCSPRPGSARRGLKRPDDWIVLTLGDTG